MDGSHEVVARVASFPVCIDFLPDGRLLVVDSAQRRLLRREPGGSLVTHADLSGSRPSRGTTSWSMTGATLMSIPSASTSPAASSRRAWSCSPHPGRWRLRMRAQPGPDPRLFVVGQIFGGPEPAQPSGQVVVPAPAPGAGKP
jgi:hypothetical protein